MTKGSPDFSNVRSDGISLGVPAPSELLNRPKDVISINISGQCILYNDFEDGTLNAGNSSTNTPNYIGIAVNNIYPGHFSCNMSTNAIINSMVRINNKVPYSVAEKCGLEAIMYCNVSNAQIRHMINYYDGVNIHEACIRFDTTDGKTYLYDNTGTFIDISSLISHDFPRVFYQSVKLVIDFITGYYIRLLYNGINIDLSSYQYKKTANTAKSAIEYAFRIDNITAVIADLYVDNIVVTIQEP